MSTPAVHRLIASTAMSMAAELYDTMAQDDEWYKQHRSQKKFVRTQWPKLINDARTTLGGMLHANSGMSEMAKAEIYEALVLDASLPNMNLENQVRMVN
jgi:hypothetical protein